MAEEKKEEKSALENFLGELGGEKDSFEENPDDPFAKQEAKVEDKVEDEANDKPLPFHKDPKVQKFIDKQVEKRLEQLEKSLPKKETIETSKADDEVNDVLTRLIGNDTPEKVSMVKEFRSILERGTERAKAEALAELDQRQQREVDADREAETELENAFDDIEETYDVDITSNNPLARKTRQEFVSFVERIAPKDRDGDIVDYPDMLSAWETYSELKKSTASPSRAKELASRSMARSTEVANKPQERVNWDTVDSFVESLGK